MNDDDLQPYGVEVFRAYSSDTKTQDYALLVLDDPIGLKTGYFGLWNNTVLPYQQHEEVTTATLKKSGT